MTASKKPVRKATVHVPKARGIAAPAKDGMQDARGKLRRDSRSGVRPEAPRTRRGATIVSSSHLADSEVPEMSEFEFGLIVAGNAFNRWVARCMAAAGLTGLGAMDVLVLHHVHHRARDKRLGDISFTLNIEDLHVVNYSLKKLLAAGVVETSKVGKEVLYRTNAAGRAYIERYREIRERCLIAALSPEHGDGVTVADTARVLRWLSGLYDQAARAATSL